MVKKVLFVATVFRFLHFEKSDMEILKKKEYEIHTATNMTGYDWLSDDGSLDYLELHKHQIDFGRSPFSKNTFEAYRQLKVLLKEEHFDVNTYSYTCCICYSKACSHLNEKKRY